MKKSIPMNVLRIAIFCSVLFPISLGGLCLGQQSGKHLFILSGQSNMQGHRPKEAFIPAVNKTFGEQNVIVIQDAQGGQPIHRWYKEWKSPEGSPPKQIGDLYDRLMTKVQPAIKDQKIASVTFLWMQGENDARRQWGEVYADSLVGLHKQLSQDLKRDDVNFVIGRLSDCGNDNKRFKHWTMIREAQVATANGNEQFAWVDTDDLNDGTNRSGKKIQNDLHYSAEGYKTLGKRFAKKSIDLIQKRQTK